MTPSSPSKCPVCGKKLFEVPKKYRPFCSERCAQIDLGRWLTESYVVPATPADEEPEK